jgi:AcrR family transcriptional regulator
MVSNQKNKRRIIPTNRSDKRVERTRKKLLAAAIEVFSEYGIDGTTIDDITERADLGKGTFYRHFADKKDIATTLIEQTIDSLRSRFMPDNGLPSRIEDMLEHLLNVHYRFFIDSNEEFILLFQGRLLLKLDRKISEFMEEPFNRYLEEIERVLSPYLPGKIDILRVRRLACAVAGFVFGFLSFAMIGMDTDQIEDSIKPLRQSFVKSLTSFLAN